MIPNILAIAGSDPSGGAGIQADIKAISANGGYAMAVVTALTAQNTRGVQGVELVASAFIEKQIRSIRDDIRIDAVKIGMLATAQIIESVAASLSGLDVPVVIDPVMVAKGGDRLLAEDAIAALRSMLVPLGAVITPNLPEAADLLGISSATTRGEMEAQAAGLLDLGAKAVLLKGGHLEGEDSPDLLQTLECSEWLDGPRHHTKNTHGTGCTLSSAFATRIAVSGDLGVAAREAKDYVALAIKGADRLDVGGGHGPTDHFHAMRESSEIADG